MLSILNLKSKPVLFFRGQLDSEVLCRLFSPLQLTCLQMNLIDQFSCITPGNLGAKVTTPTSLTPLRGELSHQQVLEKPVRASSGKGDVSFWFYIVVQNSLLPKEK